MKTSVRLVLLVLLLTCSSALCGYQIKILPLGDSITHANSSYYSYRYNLWKKLIDHDINFDFIGSMDTNFGGNPDWPEYKGLSFDSDHEGHYGWRAEELLYGRATAPELGDLTDWLEVYTPDIVLLHIGTNDIGAGQSHISTSNEIKQIIDTIRLKNPDVTVLLAKIIPRSWTYNDIIAFNEYIEPIAQDKSLPRSPVIVVDQWTGFDYEEDTYDNTHPDASGEEKMAEKWFQAILPCLKDFDGNINLDDKVDRRDLFYIAENWAAKLSVNLYLGDNFNDVNNADTSSPIYVGNLAGNSYEPGSLEPSESYYWRVDEIDVNGLHRGDVWEFTTGGDDSNIGWWKLDGKAEDLSGNNNDGVVFGKALVKNDPNWLGCLYFDGYNDYVQVANEAAFDLTSEVTIAAWVRLDSDEERIYTIASKGVGFWLYQDSYIGATVFSCDGLGRPLQSSTNICDGQWHHVVAAYDGAERAIYIDGVKDGSGATTGAMALNDEHLLVGNNELHEADNKFEGMIREFRIYSSRLSDEQILWLSRTDNYSPGPFDGQDNVGGDTKLMFSPRQWIDNKKGDLNKDFAIDFEDFTILAKDWLENIY